MKEIVVFDTFAFFFRNYYALPPLKNREGFPTGLLTGFVNFLHSLRSDFHEERFVFALDSKGDSFRKELYGDYKANRPAPPPELIQQLPVAISWIEQMGFHNISIPGYEADDVIATLAQKAKSEGFVVKIVSSDKDLYQLIDDDRVVMFDPVKKIAINADACFQKFGVRPENFVDFQAILGDSSDNVPGVKGIGEKGASKLINEYKTLENIYANIESITPTRTKNLLLEHKENAFLSQNLVRLVGNLEIDFDPETCPISDVNPLVKIADELIKYDMTQALERVKRESVGITIKEKKEEVAFSVELLDSTDKLQRTIDAIPADSIVCIDIETDALDHQKANVVGFGFSYEKTKSYYVPLLHNYLGVGEQVAKTQAKEAITKLLKHKVIGHNLKFDLAILYRFFGLSSINIHADTMVMAWLLDPEGNVGLDTLMKRHFSHEMISYKETVKKGEDFSQVEIEQAAEYCGEDVCATYYLFNKLRSEFAKRDEEAMLDEAEKVEFPFVKTLIDIENRGIKIDVDFFEKLKSETNTDLGALTQNIYDLAESEFNINSTQQLAGILFEKLKLKATKKTKTGYSTNEKVLSDLYDEHPIIPKILEYREIFKLKSTYIEPLINYAVQNSEHRIFTSFLQTGTATGRLSSKNPNLQNIPVRTEVGRKIREGFIAKEGYQLISLDYSQIELRLLAHFSQDKTMREAFFENKDIHLETSKKIFGEALAKEKRPIAKSINFGLIYGMGARKLAETIKVSQKEAKDYIDSYFASFPTVKSYLESAEQDIEKNNFSSTLLGRKRYFDFSSAAAYVKAAFLREGVNTIFQGSAADIIKLTMNKIDREHPEKKMLLQIHDELIFEAESDKAESVGEELKAIMENITQLEVPLLCGLSIGDNWGELK